MSLLKGRFHIVSRPLYYLLVIAAILLMLLIGSTVWISGAVQQRKDQAADWIGEKIGYPVEIGSIELYWLDLVPKIHVRGLLVKQQDNQNALLGVEHLYLGLDLLDSFNQRELVLKNASLTGLKLGLTRTKEGLFYLTGTHQQNTQLVVSKEWLKWYSASRYIVLNAISIEYDDQLYGQLSGNYQLNNALVSHGDERWQTTAKLQLPEGLGESLLVNGEMFWSADSAQLQTWQWRLKSENVAIAPFLKQTDLKGIKFEQGTTKLNVFAQGNGHEIKAVSADVSIKQAKLIAKDKKNKVDPVFIDKFQGQLDWLNNGKGWRLDGHDIRISINNELWPATQFSFERNETGLVNTSIGYLRLSDLTAIALLTPSSPSQLLLHQPAGDLEALNVEYSIQDGLRRASMAIKDFAALPGQDIPGVTGLNAEFNWHEQNATVKLDSHQVHLYPEKWLEDAVFFDSITGVISWQQKANWQITANELRLWNEDLALQLDGQIRRESNSTHTDLNIQLEQIELNKWQNYVPEKLLDEDFNEWAIPAFKAGKLIDGSIQLKGDLAYFPFNTSKQNGEFKLLLNAENVELEYAEDWPALSNVDAVLTGNGQKLTIDSQVGQIAGFKFANVITEIDKYLVDAPILRVDANLNGTTQQALEFLKASPLKSRFGPLTDYFNAKGNTDIDLALMVPLIDTDLTKVSGTVSFEKSELNTMQDADLQLKQVEGLLAFNNDGVSAEQISAMLLQQPVMIEVDPANGETRINFVGNMPIASINKYWKNTVPDFISGTTSYKAQLSIYEKQVGEFEFGLKIDSDLKGILIDMPIPLGKKTQQLRPLNITIDDVGSHALSYRVRYDNIIDAALMAHEQQVIGEIRLGGTLASISRTGLAVKGHIDSLNIDEWTDWQATLPQAQSPSLFDHIDLISMNIEQLSTFEQQLSKIAITAERSAQDWQISLYSDQIKGRINWPIDFDGQVPLSMDFDFVHLTIADEEEAKDKLASGIESQKVLWPGINFFSKQLTINETKFGEVSLLATRSENRWTVDVGIIQSTNLNVSVKGYWLQNEAGDFTQFQLTASSDDVKALLADLDYQQVIEAEKVDVNMDVNWKGAPTDFANDKLIGQLSLKVGGGKLIEVEPRAADRVFGLMSVAAIPRRLSLDFSDLFSKGFNFETITGDFNINEGIVTTDNLMMLGEAAKIEVMGPVNLTEQTYDQEIKITPNVSSTLPIAGAVAGGPIGLGVGTAILLVDKLADSIFGTEIVNIISYSYKLTGPWDDPQLNIVKPLSN